MVEISLSGSGEGPGWATARGYSIEVGIGHQPAIDVRLEEILDQGSRSPHIRRQHEGVGRGLALEDTAVRGDVVGRGLRHRYGVEDPPQGLDAGSGLAAHSCLS